VNQYKPNSRDDAIGDGPELSAFDAAVKLALNTETSGFWRSRGDYKYPAPVPHLDTRARTTYRAFGTLFFLHLLVTGHPPEGLSPFLFYLLISSSLLPEESKIDISFLNLGIEFISHLDLDAAKTFEPWMALQFTDRVNGTALASSLAISGVQVSLYYHSEFLTLTWTIAS
jgi:hypothetical protein